MLKSCDASQFCIDQVWVSYTRSEKFHHRHPTQLSIRLGIRRCSHNFFSKKNSFCSFLLIFHWWEDRIHFTHTYDNLEVAMWEIFLISITKWIKTLIKPYLWSLSEPRHNNLQHVTWHWEQQEFFEPKYMTRILFIILPEFNGDNDMC